jgi:hypothetical protein
MQLQGVLICSGVYLKELFVDAEDKPRSGPLTYRPSAPSACTQGLFQTLIALIIMNMGMVNNYKHSVNSRAL